MIHLTLAAAPWSGMENSYPPLGLGYLAAAILEDPEIDARIRIMDLGLYPRMPPVEAVKRILQDEKPDILGLTCLTNNFEASLELAALARAAHPTLKTVFGGAHPSVDPAGVAACDEVDVVVYGEGESTLRELLKRNPEGAWAEGVAGCAYKDQGEIRVNPPRDLIEDLDTLPFPARELMDIQKYRLFSDDGLPVYTLLSSRGCPYSCSYCFKGVFGSRFRARSASNVLAEIKALQRSYEARHLYFGDDIFMLKPGRVREICEGMLKEELHLSWSCLARVDAVTPELLDVMKRAGCVQIHYGIESGCDEILKGINKKIDLENVEKAVRWTRAAGIRTKGYFMAGLPGDTEETLEKTLRFARRLPLDEVMFSLATPFPGTALFEERVKNTNRPGIDAYGRAFYFDDGAGEVKAFFNLSEVKDERLEAFVRKAQALFKKRKDRAAFRRRHGPILGDLAHLAYRFFGRKAR
jgi:anaerobic magnesium-protoporphyrin IX monomethyl ester cyclase